MRSRTSTLAERHSIQTAKLTHCDISASIFCRNMFGKTPRKSISPASRACLIGYRQQSRRTKANKPLLVLRKVLISIFIAGWSGRAGATAIVTGSELYAIRDPFHSSNVRVAVVVE